MDFLRTWILAVAAAAIFCAVMTELCPKGQVKAIVKFLCGALMSLALISPLIEFERADYSLNLSRYRLEAGAIAAEGQNLAQSYERTIIEESLRAYILDKAAALGCEIAEVSFGMRWSSEGFWYPEQCTLTGQYSEGLSSAIAAELGIGRESQKWSGENENT